MTLFDFHDVPFVQPLELFVLHQQIVMGPTEFQTFCTCCTWAGTRLGFLGILVIPSLRIQLPSGHRGCVDMYIQGALTFRPCRLSIWPSAVCGPHETQLDLILTVWHLLNKHWRGGSVSSHTFYHCFWIKLSRLASAKWPTLWSLWFNIDWNGNVWKWRPPVTHQSSGLSLSLERRRWCHLNAGDRTYCLCYHWIRTLPHSF